MNILKRFVSGLGQQTAQFGFSPEDPNASYQAGLSYIGDIGANLMANNQGGVDPWANLGASMQQAKQSGTQRNKEQYTAQRLMEEAAYKKQEREQAKLQEAQREELLKTLPPDVQMKARSVPGFLEDYLKATDQAFQSGPELTADQRNFEYAQSHPEFAGFLNQGKAGGGSSWGMTAVPLKNKKTNKFAVGQLNQGQGGVFINGQPADPSEWEYDPGAVAQDKAFGNAVGGARGDAVAGAPGDIAAADIALGKITELRTDPNRVMGTGASSIFNGIPATPGYDFQTKVDEVTAGAFLTAIQQMRGLGQLSNVEGQTAKQAVTRMKTATSEQEFLDALSDYEEIVTAGKKKAQGRLNQGAPGGPSPIPAPNGQSISGNTSTGVPWSVE